MSGQRPVAILFDRLGPYHAARLAAAARLLPVLAVELAAESAEYAWDKVEGAGAFERLTLFPAARPATGAETAARVVALLEERQPAAVAIPGWADALALAALGWCARSGKPAIVMSESTAHDATRHAVREWIKRTLLRGCSAALVGGSAHVAYLATLGFPRDRIFTGYDIVNNAHFAVADPPRGGGFLASARFIEKKNLPRLLRVYAAYRREGGGWPLTLLGDGPLRRDLLALRDELGLTAHVAMPGFEQYDGLPSRYAAADAFIHASTTEQWGLVVNEAMAAGLPVLVSKRCGCAPDLVAEGRNGFTFDPEDEAEITARLRDLSSSPDLQRMGEASREIIADWTPTRFGEGMKSAVETALSRPRQASPLTRSLAALLARR